MATGVAILNPVPAQGNDSAERWRTFSDETVKKISRLRSPDLMAEEIGKFSGEDYAESAQYLIDFLEGRHSPNLAKVAAEEVLGKFRDPEARDLVKKAASLDNGKNVYLLRAYLDHGDPESRQLLLNLAAKARTPRSQAIAIDGIRQLGGLEELSEGYVAALIKWIEDEESFHGIRVSAAKTLGEIPDRNSVAVLIAHLNDPLLREVARDGLTRQTGLDHWNDVPGWLAWWKTNQADFVPQPMKAADYEKKIRTLRQASADLSMEFYGIKLTGKNILFILDSSGSMLTDDRIGRLRDELSAMISQLHEGYQFGLIMFPMASIPGRDFDQADDRFKKRALEFVENLQADGDTPMGAAIDHAFGRIVPKKNVDTIYLLSDGVPTDMPPDELLDELMGHCDTYGTVVHTVFIGDEAIGEKLMDEIAEMTGGRFAHIQ